MSIRMHPYQLFHPTVLLLRKKNGRLTTFCDGVILVFDFAEFEVARPFATHIPLASCAHVRAPSLRWHLLPSQFELAFFALSTD